MTGKILKESLFDNQVVTLTLNNPKGNVLDAEMMADLQSALDEIKDNQEIKLIQFIGAGDHFSFGACVEEHTKDKAPAMLKQFHGLFHSLANLSIPTAAIVSGQCLGGGTVGRVSC